MSHEATQQAASTYAVPTAMCGKNYRLPTHCWPGETFEELSPQTLKAEVSKKLKNKV